MTKVRLISQLIFISTLFSAFFLITSIARAQSTLKEVVDQVVTRMYSELDSSQLDTISYDFVYNYLTKEERTVMATRYWVFEVNNPVTVSVMRDTQQVVLPFWILESGFKKTDLKVRNTSTTYEVWQKDFDAGTIGLGINGWDRNRNTYFISTKSKIADSSLSIKPIFPKNQYLSTMKAGAFVYHDWDELLLYDVPESLISDVLFTTIRGRSREAHLVNAFRKTEFSSSKKPDQILLTWSDSPKTTVDIQWRASTEIDNAQVEYWLKGSSDTLMTDAQKEQMEDRLLQNDRYIYRFTAQIKNLKPGQRYGYKVINDLRYESNELEFETDSDTLKPFSFFWTGDIHIADRWGEMMKSAYERHPETSFFITSGDLVNTGLFRDQWDKLFDLPGNVFGKIPFMASPGNHDSQEGLGAWMFQKMYSYPLDSPTPETRELTYAFEYQNALFLMLDPTQPIEDQSNWIEQKLASSPATWKFVTFHFAPYNVVENYDDIIAEWLPLFDKYHVDLVFTGHWHYYMRTQPMKANKVVKNSEDGTIYLISVGTFGKNKEKSDNHTILPDYIQSQFAADFLYQHIKVDGNSLRYNSYNENGKMVDSFSIEK